MLLDLNVSKEMVCLNLGAFNTPNSVKKQLSQLRLRIVDANLARAIYANKLTFTFLLNHAEQAILGQLNTHGYFEVGELASLASNSQVCNFDNYIQGGFGLSPIAQLMSQVFTEGLLNNIPIPPIQNKSEFLFPLTDDLNSPNVTIIGFMLSVIHLVAKQAVIKHCETNQIEMTDALKQAMHNALVNQVSNSTKKINYLFSTLAVQSSRQIWHIDRAIVNLSQVSGSPNQTLGTLALKKQSFEAFSDKVLAKFNQANLKPKLLAMKNKIVPIATQLNQPNLTAQAKNKLNNQLFTELMQSGYKIDLKSPTSSYFIADATFAIPIHKVNLYFGAGMLQYLSSVLADVAKNMPDVFPEGIELSYNGPHTPLIHSSPNILFRNTTRTVSAFSLNYAA